jgi:hypothetical protein
MSYTAGGNIQAADYNSFATLVNGVNGVFADSNSGAVTLPLAGLGYGQSPALTSVSAGNPVTATQWAALFTAMKNCGTHQGSTVVPPLPVTNPIATDIITAFNTPTSFASVVALLNTNSRNLGVAQTGVIAGSGFANPAPWTTSLVYTFQVDFGSWNNARYFFNSGGSVSITGAYTPAPTPDEAAWATLFTDDFPVNMNWQKTSQPSGNIIVNQAGFYQDPSNAVLYPGLTTTYQTTYQKYAGGGVGPYYATNYATVEAKLTNAAGTDGKIDYRVSLFDNDTFPVLKAASRMTYTINRIQSSGAIAYPGGYTFTSGGFVAV